MSFLFFVAIWMRKKDAGKNRVKNVQTAGYYGARTVLRFFICQSKNELKFNENFVHQIIEMSA